jgi:hypothetical protein
MDKEPMNNWVLEIEKLQTRMDKVEKVLGPQLQQQPQPKPAPAPAPLAIGARKDH